MRPCEKGAVARNENVIGALDTYVGRSPSGWSHHRLYRRRARPVNVHTQPRPFRLYRTPDHLQSAPLP